MSLTEAHAALKRTHDRTHRQEMPQPGDLVSLGYYGRRTRRESKLGARWTGPIAIMKRITDLACTLDFPRSMRLHLRELLGFALLPSFRASSASATWSGGQAASISRAVPAGATKNDDVQPSAIKIVASRAQTGRNKSEGHSLAEGKLDETWTSTRHNVRCLGRRTSSCCNEHIPQRTQQARGAGSLTPVPRLCGTTVACHVALRVCGERFKHGDRPGRGVVVHVYCGGARCVPKLGRRTNRWELPKCRSSHYIRQ